MDRSTAAQSIHQKFTRYFITSVSSVTAHHSIGAVHSLTLSHTHTHTALCCCVVLCSVLYVGCPPLFFPFCCLGLDFVFCFGRPQRSTSLSVPSVARSITTRPHALIYVCSLLHFFPAHDPIEFDQSIRFVGRIDRSSDRHRMNNCESSRCAVSIFCPNSQLNPTSERVFFFSAFRLLHVRHLSCASLFPLFTLHPSASPYASVDRSPTGFGLSCVRAFRVSHSVSISSAHDPFSHSHSHSTHSLILILTLFVPGLCSFSPFLVCDLSSHQQLPFFVSLLPRFPFSAPLIVRRSLMRQIRLSCVVSSSRLLVLSRSLSFSFRLRLSPSLCPSIPLDPCPSLVSHVVASFFPLTRQLRFVVGVF